MCRPRVWAASVPLFFFAFARSMVFAGDLGYVTDLEGVTATATKTERSAYDVPASVHVITTERIETEQPQIIDDLLQHLPNRELFSEPRRTGETVNICDSTKRGSSPLACLLSCHLLRTPEDCGG